MAVETSYAKGEDTPALLTETIGATLARTTRAYGGNLALVDAGQGDPAADRSWTYEEFHRDVRAVAAGLLRIGVDTGDRVGLWSPNRAEWVIVQYATAEIGAILVNINPAYRQTELEYVLNQAGVSVVLATDRFKDSEYAAMLGQAQPACPGLRGGAVRLARMAGDAERTGPRRGGPSRADRGVALTRRSDQHQYTSGTTSFPKGATLSHRNIGNNGYLVGSCSNTPTPTGSACRCRSITASAW